MTENTAIDAVQERMETDFAAFALKYHLDEANVRKYAESMTAGNSSGAHYALGDIRREVRLNTQEISFVRFVELFKPIREELCAQYGDIDQLTEKTVRNTMDERDRLETAGKLAQEEAEAEIKRLQEFRNMDNGQLDDEYFKAVEANNEPRMRDLVNESARRNGYVSDDGFRMAHRAPSYDEGGVDKNFFDIAGNKGLIRESLNEQLRMNRDVYGDESALAINKILSAIDNGEKPAVTIYRAVPKSLKEGKVRNVDWISLSESYVRMHGEHALGNNFRIMKEEVSAENLYWDGNDINEWGYDDRNEYRYKDTKNNRKLDDLISYDDKGNIIPPSKRFNSHKEDIRFRFIGEEGAANLDRAEEAAVRLDNLATAREMERAGKDAQVIKISTGWERGADELWRYEEPDFILCDTILQKDGNCQVVVPLQEIIRDENLFKAYPFLKGTVVAEDKGTGEGFYSKTTNIIGLNTKKFIPVKSNSSEGQITEIRDKLKELEAYPEVRTFNRMFESCRAGDEVKINSYASEHPNVGKYSELEDKLWDLCHNKEIVGYQIRDRATIVHEVQHAIQCLEGFARGGSAEEFADTKLDVIKDLNFFTDGGFLKGNAITDSQSVRLALDKKIPYTDMSLSEGYREGLRRVPRKYGYRDLEHLIDNFDSMPTAREQYHKLAGEVEARNAETRMDLTREERGNTLSVTTEDVPRKGQTVLTCTKEHMELAGYASSLAEKQHIPVSVISSFDDIPSQKVRRLIAERADVRGWYDVPSQRVCLYLPNATGKEDIQHTLLHEGVGHYGLRKTIGNENMDRFLDTIYTGAAGQVRRDIQGIAFSHNVDIREATEEYLATLAERNTTPGFRDKIRQFLTDILRAIGFNIDIKSKELELILSKSKENLQSVSPDKNAPTLFFKGGRREIRIDAGKAVIRTNGNEYDATAVLKSLEQAKVDIRAISKEQWGKMLKGQGIVLDPERPASLFSIQKQSSGYGVRMVSYAGNTAQIKQNEL